MARQVLPIVGAVVGAYFGNPQLGYAIGSIIGNAVDPQRLKGPRLNEIPSQTAGEGGYRQVVYGTCWVNSTNVIDFGEIRRVTVEERQGKGGGPIIESERLYRTYAIGLGEPLAAIRVIRRNGTIVYDTRPGSAMLAESAAFSERFRFYSGAEDQLPDPDLEALPQNGVGNTPYYRGTSYLVFPNDDLTDVRGQIPTYEVEGISIPTSAVIGVALLNNKNHFSGARDAMESEPAIGWPSTISLARLSPNGVYAAGSDPSDTGADRFVVYKYDEDTATWGALADPIVMPAKGPNGMAWSPDSQYLAIGFDGTEKVIVYKLVSDVLTKIADPDILPPQIPYEVEWDSTGQRLALGQASTGNPVIMYDFIAATDTLTNYRTTTTFGLGAVGSRIAFLPGIDSRYIAVGTDENVFVVNCSNDPMTLAAFVQSTTEVDGIAGVHWDRSSGYLVTVGQNNGPDFVRIYDFDYSVIGSESLTEIAPPITQPSVTPVDSDISSDGDYLAIAENGEATPLIYDMGTTLPPMPTPLAGVPAATAAINSVSWSQAPSIPQYAAGAIPLSDLVEDICDRCGLLAAKLDLSELTDEVAGVVLGGPYDGAGAITVLMPAYFFDVFEGDRLVKMPKRGAAVITTITENDLIEEPDENTLRGQDIEFPRSILLKYLDPGQNYAAPAATVQRNSPDIRVRGEALAEIPISLNRTEAFRVADRMLKVMWEDLNGEVTFSLPVGPFAWLTPTDCLGLSLRGALYRIRVEKVEYAAGVLKVTARRDRQSAYTSVLTPIPLPEPETPPTSLISATQFVVINSSGIIDSDDRLGIRIGASGLDGYAWGGCVVRASTDGGANWTYLADITTRAQIGNLIQSLSEASPYYTDTTNTLSVLMLDSREIEGVTQTQLLNELNGAAIARADGTCELIQFRDVVDEGSDMWSLSYLWRGRLDTSSAAHSAGAKFVLLDGTVFVPLPSSYIGQTIILQFVSYGSSPEVAPTFSFVWDPAHSQTEWAPLDLEVTRTGGNIEASWTQRHRFGTDANPIASTNYRGARVVMTDGTTTVSSDTTADSLGASDVFTGPVTVSVSQLNRITQAGPATSEVVP
jgi:hypothetical protein